MPTVIKVSTDSAFEHKYSYSRAVAVNDWIYVSLTAGRNPANNKISEDASEQTFQIFENIESALSIVGASLKDVIFSRVFIQNPLDVSAVIDILGEKFRTIDPATTICCSPLTSDIYKVEIEVTAFRGANDAEVKRIKVNNK